MPIGPALVLGALGVLGLVAAMGGAKKASASPGGSTGSGQAATVTASSGNTYTTKLVNTVGDPPDREHIVDVFIDDSRIIRYAQNLDTKMRRYIGSPLSDTDSRVIQARRDFNVTGDGLSAAPLPKPSGGGGTVKPINIQEGGRPMSKDLLELLGKTLQGLHVDEKGNVTKAPSAEAIQAATGVAVTLRAAGYPDAADTILDIVERAKKLVPPPAPAAQIPLPALSKELSDQVQRMLQLEGDPAKLRALAAALKKLPAANDTMVRTAIEALEAKALQLDLARATAEGMKEVNEVMKSPGLPQAQPGTTLSPPSPATLPTSLPTAAAKTKQQLVAERLAGHLLMIQGNDVKKAKGKEDKSTVMTFQKQEGLSQDGKAGPGVMTKLAKYVSALPLVMYWPQGATQKNVIAYRAGLNEMADDAEVQGDIARANALRTSASRERGQAGIVGPMPA